MSYRWVVVSLLLLCGGNAHGAGSFVEAVRAVQPKVVKIYGAGGLRGLEHYQSGFLISSEGHVLTVWSYVLDTDDVAVVLDDGRRFKGELVGSDPRLEIAVLKIDASNLSAFQLQAAVELNPGDRVLAFSNLFGVASGEEDASVQHGHVSASTKLAARRGVYETPYQGQAYVLDAMTNNPGTAGGALTDRRGQLAGMLGKELRSVQDNTWLNYALPIPEIASAVEDILAGRSRRRSTEPEVRRPLQPASLPLLGIVLIPDVLAKTPPFVDRVVSGSPAGKAGVQPDDLVLFINDRVASSIQGLEEELSYIDRIDEVRLVLQRGSQLVQVSLFVVDR
ncbi:MAG: S1C family serine protease [Pirellulaceae bacterium]